MNNKNVTKPLLIIAQLLALVFLMLHFFEVLSNKYIPVLCFSILTLSMIYVILTEQKTKK